MNWGDESIGIDAVAGYTLAMSTPDMQKAENRDLHARVSELEKTIVGLSSKLIAAEDGARFQKVIADAMTATTRDLTKTLDERKRAHETEIVKLKAAHSDSIDALQKRLAIVEDEGKRLRESRAADRDALEELRVLVEAAPMEPNMSVLDTAIREIRLTRGKRRKKS